MSRARRLAVLMLALCTVRAVAGSEDHAIEYQVKAAFLYQFLKFVDWPDAPADRPWMIGVAGSEPFAAVLSTTLKGKTVRGRPVTVVCLSQDSDWRRYHIVFFPAPRKGDPKRAPGVLTVGEDSRFLAAGGILNFFLRENKIHFEISAEAAKSAGLRMSAQLMELGSVR